MSFKLLYYVIGAISWALAVAVDVWLGVSIPTFLVMFVYCHALVAVMFLFIFILTGIYQSNKNDGNQY
ncbi:hypothetical protein [Gilliamella sp. BG6]|uniref:hypothetical protein n=1 Tax=unclassified Gilliamella TaxID=2685620 RepID=UPI003987DF56